MQVWLRLLVVWFVALALPVQGIAGVAMARCEAPLHRVCFGQEAPLHPHADHGTGAAHHHGQHMQQSGHHPQAADASAAEAQPGPWSDLSPHKCSSCAACCAGTALTRAPPRVPQATAAAPIFAVARVVVDAFASDGPDRPPRTPLV